MTVWNDAPDAEARMSRVLSGALNIPPELLQLAVAGPEGRPLLDYFQAVHAGDPSALRREVLGELVRIKGQLEMCFEAIERADEAERERMHRVEPARIGTRRRA